MQAEHNERRLEIADRLRAHWRTVDPATLVPVERAEAKKYVLSDPFAFLVACSFDRGMDAGVVWSIPYALDRVLQPLSPSALASRSLDQLTELVRRMSVKPRYTNDAPKTLRDLAALVMREGEGDAARLWADGSALRFQRSLMSVHGVGPGIATMSSILVERFWNVQFVDPHAIDVKPDVHVKRVMFRLGLIERQSEELALKAARQLSPLRPADLDSPLWQIGREWCRETAPKCGSCPLHDICPREGIN